MYCIICMYIYTHTYRYRYVYIYTYIYIYIYKHKYSIQYVFLNDNTHPQRYVICHMPLVVKQHHCVARRGADELVKVSIPLPAPQWLSILIEDSVTVHLQAGQLTNRGQLGITWRYQHAENPQRINGQVMFS